MENQRIETVTIKSNSFSGRYGGTGTEVKIYFDTLDDLTKGIDIVVEGKLYFEKRLNEGAKDGQDKSIKAPSGLGKDNRN